MQGPRGDEILQSLDGYEQMVDTFAEQAKAYWGLWGPLGEPYGPRGRMPGRRRSARTSSGCGKLTGRVGFPNPLALLARLRSQGGG